MISPALANCALDGLERLLREKYPAGKRLKSLGGEKPCVNLVRYADDFVITSKSKELLEGEIKPLVEQFLQERGLELSPKKTVITHVERGFDFLGQNVRRYPNGKLLIKPSKKNVKTFLDGSASAYCRSTSAGLLFISLSFPSPVSIAGSCGCCPCPRRRVSISRMQGKGTRLKCTLRLRQEVKGVVAVR